MTLCSTGGWSRLEEKWCSRVLQKEGFKLRANTNALLRATETNDPFAEIFSPRRGSDSLWIFYAEDQCDIRELCILVCSVFPLSQYFLKITQKITKMHSSACFSVPLLKGLFSTRPFPVSQLFPLFTSGVLWVCVCPLSPTALFWEVPAFSKQLLPICYAACLRSMPLGTYDALYTH